MAVPTSISGPVSQSIDRSQPIDNAPSSSIVLGIESSCDDMAAAVVQGSEILSSSVQGQNHVHEPYGGVVPELASRDHVRTVSAVVAEALAVAGIPLEAIDGIAVTAGPGLIGSLLVGLSFGKALAYRCGVPVVGVHHLAGHLASAELADPELAPPYIGLVTSGAHTSLYRVGSAAGNDAEVESAVPVLLGATRDDAVGEAFDKVAKLLGLGFPGGPAIAAAAVNGREDAVDLPRPMLAKAGLDFSYSGLKTAVALEVERRGALTESDVADIAASFQAAATDVLVKRARKALAREKLSKLAVVGGVAANLRLRGEMQAAARRDGFDVFFPPAELCTDNAAMIASAGARLLQQGEHHGLGLNSFSRVQIDEAPWA
jgi:N6-L-threonylcarbamoyladenine synthase